MLQTLTPLSKLLYVDLKGGLKDPLFTTWGLAHFIVRENRHCELTSVRMIEEKLNGKLPYRLSAPQLTAMKRAIHVRLPDQRMLADEICEELAPAIAESEKEHMQIGLAVAVNCVLKGFDLSPLAITAVRIKGPLLDTVGDMFRIRAAALEALGDTFGAGILREIVGQPSARRLLTLARAYHFKGLEMTN